MNIAIPIGTSVPLKRPLKHPRDGTNSFGLVGHELAFNLCLLFPFQKGIHVYLLSERYLGFSSYLGLKKLKKRTTLKIIFSSAASIFFKPLFLIWCNGCIAQSHKILPTQGTAFLHLSIWICLNIRLN